MSTTKRITQSNQKHLPKIVQGCQLPPGLSHFLACRKVSSMRSLKSMYPMGSEMMMSTISGSSTSSTLPAITTIRLNILLLCTRVYNGQNKHKIALSETVNLLIQIFSQSACPIYNEVHLTSLHLNFTLICFNFVIRLITYIIIIHFLKHHPLNNFINIIILFLY